MTGCLTRFFPSSLHRFIFSFRSFGIVSHLHKFQNHESYSNSTDTEERREREREKDKKNGFFRPWLGIVEENRFHPREGWRDSIRHANVSSKGTKYFSGGRNANVGSMRLVASLEIYFQLNDPLLAFYRRGMDPGQR